MPLSRKTLINVGLLILVNAMWAAQYAAYKTATQQMGPITVSAWTFLLASILLSLFLIRERRWSGKQGDPQGSTPAWRARRSAPFGHDETSSNLW